MRILTINKQNHLLMISGMFAGSWIWRDTLPKLSNASISTVEEPLCALGGNLERICDDISEEMNALEGQITLAGNSLGSLVCLMLAARHKHKVKNVIISGAAGFGPIKLDLVLTPKNAREAMKKIARMVCYDHDKIQDDDYQLASDAFSGNYRNILRLIRQSNAADAPALLDEIECPITAVWGENDIITPLHDAHDFLERHNILTHVFPECGHSPMYERPEEFADVIKACIR